MTFLQKFGSIVLKIVGIATEMMPLIRQAVPQTGEAVAVEDKLSAAFSVVATAEQMFTAAGVPKAGSAKLKAATPYVAGLVQNLPVFTGKKPKDEAAFEQHVTALTSSLADIFNDYGD